MKKGQEAIAVQVSTLGTLILIGLVAVAFFIIIGWLTGLINFG